MDQDLKKLMESSEFKQYHQAVQNPPFNLFDVLRHADYEIRHSNVLEWLLDPGGTHGTASKFLQGFIRCLNHHADVAEIKRIPVPASFEEDNVSVERELHFADIAVLFKKERRWMIIENKTVERSRKHYEQVKSYERDFRKRYKGQYTDVRSVLLTTSSEGDASEQRVIHLGWSDVQALIERVLDEVAPRNDEVRIFLCHYLDIVKRLIAQSRFERNYFTNLVSAHRLLLTRLLEEKQGGARLLRSGVPDDYRATIDQLVDDFRREPKRLRTSVKAFLNATRGMKSNIVNNKYGTEFWLFWRMDEVAKALGIEWHMKWEIAFSHRKVSVGLYVDLTSKTRPVVERIEKFMREMDIATDELIWDKSENYLYIYRHPLVDEEMLSVGSFEEVEKATREKVDGFLDSEYRAIQGYFKCLAADPKGLSEST